MAQVIWRNLVLFCTATFCGLPSSAATAPFVIAPMIEGVGYCTKGASSTSLAAAIAACVDEPNPSANLIQVLRPK